MDSERLAEIEGHAERWEVKGTVEQEIDGEPWGVEGVVGIAVTIREADYDWLVNRLKGLGNAYRGSLQTVAFQGDEIEALQARVSELEAQMSRDAPSVEAVLMLGKALAHLNDGHYSLSDATKEVEDAEKLLSDVSERAYYAALAAGEET